MYSCPFAELDSLPSLLTTSCLERAASITGLTLLPSNVAASIKYFAYGRQNDYFDDQNIIGWTREGDYEHSDSGMAVIMSDNAGGCKQMNVGSNLANTVLYDCTGNMKETVYVDNEGNGIFYCQGGSVSVWIKKNNIYENK